MDRKTMSSIIIKKDGTSYGSCRHRGVSLSCSLNLSWYNGEADMLLHDHTVVLYVSHENEAYFTYEMTNSSILTQFVIDENGILTQLMWEEHSKIWVSSKLRLADTYCDRFAIYSHQKKQTYTCSSESSPIEPNTQQQSVPESLSTTLLQCHGGEREGFLLIPNASVIDGSNDLLLTSPVSPKDCRKVCLRNCSCRAYRVKDDVCAMWKLNTLDIYHYPKFSLYYRLATTNSRQAKSRLNLLVLGATLGGIGLITTLVILIWKFGGSDKVIMTKIMDGSPTLIKYRALCSATKNFSVKIGEGGFGSVYQGNLPNTSKGIAVKQLKIYGRGDKQFRAEVSTLGIIHHVNLVRLLGFCVKGSKRFLVYEFMPQGSLDKHIFGDSPRILDWRTRYLIGVGIAKGMAYLHNECRECIIHCDIKPENILLDDEFNPKIADFGLAKILGRDFSRVLTTMRGTRGYLAPEWISGAAITSKADVYSYGMMLFEIISGKRNWSLTINGENGYIPLQIMQTLATDGDIRSLLDNRLGKNVDFEELVRACRVAGWCIQEDEKDRLSMPQVVRILEGTLDVSNPPIPGFLQYIAEVPLESTAYWSCYEKSGLES